MRARVARLTQGPVLLEEHARLLIQYTERDELLGPLALDVELDHQVDPRSRARGRIGFECRGPGRLVTPSSRNRHATGFSAGRTRECLDIRLLAGRSHAQT